MRPALHHGPLAVAVAAALSAAATPLPARAACPVAADMEAGVVFRLATGEEERARRDGPERTVSEFVAGGYVSRVTLAHGLYPLEVVETENGEAVATPTTYIYPEGPLPAPAPGLQVSLDVGLRGDRESREQQLYIFGQPVTWTFGSCAYQVIPVTTVHSEAGEEVSRDALHYLPELGHAYLAGFSQPGSAEDVYTYVSVEAAR